MSDTAIPTTTTTTRPTTTTVLILVLVLMSWSLDLGTPSLDHGLGYVTVESKSAECCALLTSTQLMFTRCNDSVDGSNYCEVEEPFAMSSDGVLIVKVNGSNVLTNTTTKDRHIQLHNIGKHTARF